MCHKLDRDEQGHDPAEPTHPAWQHRECHSRNDDDHEQGNKAHGTTGDAVGERTQRTRQPPEEEGGDDTAHDHRLCPVWMAHLS
jgi:hypothetical protein